MRTYGEQLKALRGKVSQEEVARRLGYKRQGNLSLYENDKKRPSVKTVLRHARAFGKLPSEFLKGVLVTDYDRIRAGAYDAIPLTGVPERHTDHAAIVKSSKKRDGRVLAASSAENDSIDPVSGVSRAALRRLGGEVESLVRDAEQAGAVVESARPARSARQHVAGARAHAAGGGAPARKSRR